METILLPISGIKQKSMHCGPTCIEMVLKFYGYKNINQTQIGNDLKVVNRNGCYPSDVIRYLSRFNIVVVKTKRIKSISEIVKGYPIILGQRDHFMLLIGYEDEKYIYVDPYTGRKNKASLEWFQREIVDLLIITSVEKDNGSQDNH